MAPSQTTVPQTRPKGCSDIIGFGEKGVFVLRNTINPKAQLVLNEFGYSSGTFQQGWRVEKHLRVVADITGDGTGDIVGFGDDGVIISLNDNNNRFQPPRLVSKQFGYNAGGWHIGTSLRLLCDLRKTGRADIVGFGHSGVHVALNCGGGNFDPSTLAYEGFGYTTGWRVEKHPRFLADTTGDGYPDIIGFSDTGTHVAVNNHDGTFRAAKTVLEDFGCVSAGWTVEKHPRFVADLTGDGTVDIIGFGGESVYVAFNNGNGSFQPKKKVLDGFGYAKGWYVEKHPRFIADLTGDGRGDIVGFWDAGVCVSYNNGDGTFQAPRLVLRDFGYNSGWHIDINPRFLADFTGNGQADIVGFGDDGVYVAFNDGRGGFSPAKKIIDDFGFNAGGWRVDKHVRYPANIYCG
ncbi:hypothetical protein AX16_002821 [Volvariella volvacea WC 439]|nr:hypothetical protein AX16_002821 [Volvariella volvacea WC 439]